MESFSFLKIITPNNVAIYGSLCALATYDRSELQANVIQSRFASEICLFVNKKYLKNNFYIISSFKSFLELEPQIREILFKFYDSKYAICLKLMDQIKDHLLLGKVFNYILYTMQLIIANLNLFMYLLKFKTCTCLLISTLSISPLDTDL